MVAVTEQLIEQHADGEQVCGNVPAGETGVGRLIGRCAGLRMHRVADAGGDIEVEQLRSGASENNVARFDIAVDQPAARQFRPLVQLGFRPAPGRTLSVKLLEARRVRVESDERVQQVEGNVYRLPVAQVPLSGDELLE